MVDWFRHDFGRYNFSEPQYWSSPVLTEKCSCGGYTQAYDPRELAVWRSEHKCPNKEDK